MVLKKADKRSRNILFDLLKIVLILLVVTIHVRVIVPTNNAHLFGSYWSYAVPIFMTLSFLLMSKYFSQIKLSFSVILLRIKRILLPLIFWSGIGFLLKPSLFNLNNAFLQLMTGKVVNTALYYLDVLIWLTLIFWLITYLPPKFRAPLHFVIILTAFILEYTKINYLFFNPMSNEIKRCYGQIVELIKYASLGTLFGMLQNQNKKKFILFGLAGLSFILLTQFKFPTSLGFNYSGINLFLGTIFVLSSVMLIGNINLPTKINDFIITFSSYSFGVYLCHLVFLEKLVKILPSIKYFNSQFPLLFLFLFTIGCYAFCFLFDHLTFKKLSYLVK